MDEEPIKGGPICSHLFWIDLETTSLNIRTAKILELFILVTDRNLQPVDSLEIVIHYPEEELRGLSVWSKKQHTTLLELVKHSTISLSAATAKVVEFLDHHRRGRKAVLAGSSVNFDRQVLEQQILGSGSRIHYRVVDVSTVLELARRWAPLLHQYAPRKTTGHRAREDVWSSLNLLAFYRQSFFAQPWVTYPATSRPPVLHSVFE